MMIEIIHCLYNSHDKVNRDFVATVPENVSRYCFYTQLNDPAVQEHASEEGAYPYIGMFPSVLLKVPSYTIPSFTSEFESEDGVIVSNTPPEVVIEEHYRMLEPCETYEKVLQAVAVYEENIRKLETGEAIRDPYPHEFLQTS